MNKDRPAPGPDSLVGTVVSFQRKSALVQTEQGELRCALRKSLFRNLGAWSNPIAVGDQVRVEEVQAASGVIVLVFPRRTYLSRVRPEARDEQIIVANADVFVAMVAAAEPTFRPRLFDRFLVAAMRGSMPCVLVATKIDLVEDRAPFLAWVDLYASFGVRMVLTSLQTREGLPELFQLFSGKVVVVAGQSGVGKSSLLNELYPSLGQATQTISAKWGKGQHTTTSAQLFRTPEGGAVIDTPGVRTFAIRGLPPSEVAEGFAEFRNEIDACRFRTCTHDHEPACGVRAAVKAGRISEARYESYVRIVHGLEEED